MIQSLRYVDDMKSFGFLSRQWLLGQRSMSKYLNSDYMAHTDISHKYFHVGFFADDDSKGVGLLVRRKRSRSKTYHTMCFMNVWIFDMGPPID